MDVTITATATELAKALYGEATGLVERITAAADVAYQEAVAAKNRQREAEKYDRKHRANYGAMYVMADEGLDALAEARWATRDRARKLDEAALLAARLAELLAEAI